MYCWICLPISSNALGLSSASVYLSMMGCPRFWSRWKLQVSKRRNSNKSIQVKRHVTFNSASLSMYTCLGWSSPSSYSQFSVSSSFNDKLSRSCMAHTDTAPINPPSSNITHLNQNRWGFTHRFTDKLLQDPVKLVPHVVHILFNIILSIIPLLLQPVLHDHLTLWRGPDRNGSTLQWRPSRENGNSVGGFNNKGTRGQKLPHSPRKDSACQLRVATADCFQLVAPALLFWL